MLRIENRNARSLSLLCPYNLKIVNAIRIHAIESDADIFIGPKLGATATAFSSLEKSCVRLTFELRWRKRAGKILCRIHIWKYLIIRD